MMKYMETTFDIGIIISITIGITLLIVSAVLSLAALLILKDKPKKE
ncbi:hypothetical protein BH09PAT2_BH09PAT2_04010 [soil metagenome]